MDKDRFTHENTGYPAPTWYQKENEPTLYWTEEEIQAQRERNSQIVKKKSVLEIVSENPIKDNYVYPNATTRACVVCNRPFTSGRPGQVTCGREQCQAERRRERVQARKKLGLY